MTEDRREDTAPGETGPDWWFDGLSAGRCGFDRKAPSRVPPGEPTRQWLEGWDDTPRVWSMEAEAMEESDRDEHNGA